MTQVALVTLMHDPDGRLHRQMGGQLPALGRLFDAHYVIASAHSRPEVIDELAEMGIRCQREARPGVGAARRQGVRLARQAGHERILYCDLDRALHWVKHYPDELAHSAERVGTVDFLVLGRTTRAFASHPEVMTATESLANRTFATRFGKQWDLCAAACGLSGTAADLIMRASSVTGFGTEAEWPSLALHHGLSAGFVAVEGLEYETGDRFAEEVAAAGGLAAWTEEQSRSPENWAFRLALAADIARACFPERDADAVL
ncbi:MAG: hypothetical protein ACYC4L_03615 [Chloroflexota bacterium]